MITLKEIKSQVENVNALGKKNLIEKGVEVSEKPSTYEIMQGIAEISGGGVTYTKIVYNSNGTFTLTDTDGVEHTMECEYVDGKLTTVKYDGDLVELSYDGNVLVKVGKTELLNQSPAFILAKGLGVDYNTYPNILFYVYETSSYKRCYLYFCQSTPQGDGRNSVVHIVGHYYSAENIDIAMETDTSNVNDVIKAVLDKPSITLTKKSVLDAGTSVRFPAYSTFDFDGRDENTTLIGSMNFDKEFALGLISGGTVENDNAVFEFWDAFQDNGNRTDYKYAFYGKGWNDTTFNPKHNIIAVDDASGIFQYCKITNLKEILEKNNVTLDLSGVTTFQYPFQYSSITHLGVLDCRSLSNMGYILNNARLVESVDKIILKDDGSQIFGNIGFQYASSLKEIRFEGVIGQSISFVHSNLLSSDSVQNIIDHLATVASPQTITFHSSIALTDEQKSTISGKGWTLVQ